MTDKESFDLARCAAESAAAAAAGAPQDLSPLVWDLDWRIEAALILAAAGRRDAKQTPNEQRTDGGEKAKTQP